MKKILSSLLIAGVGLTLTTGCIQEFEPQSNFVSKDQAATAPNSYSNFVSAVTNTLSGRFLYNGTSNADAYDFGYPSFFLVRDVMGNDLVTVYSNWWSTWYECGTGLGPTYARCQYPWTLYFGWIKDANTVISMAGDEPDDEHRHGAGIAYTMRALEYMEIAQMYAQKTYAVDPESATVPIITEKTTIPESADNPRATNAEMWAFILSDLDKAEQYLADYKRADVYTPDISVVYGLKARAYLVMADWANAEKYAKLAQQGYNMMSNEDYTSRETGFNTPNGAWMFATRYKTDDPNIQANDADSSWGSAMCLEANGSGCGYASSYGQQIVIDRHLYETMPETDIRRGVFVDFAIDDLPDRAAKIEALKAYSDYPDWLYQSYADGYAPGVGGFSLKFRVAGGSDGHYNQYLGFCVSVPMMRVEEMMLIEAEAAGMQSEGRGIALLTDFAKRRDPAYVYGTHNEAYGNNSTSMFQNEVWWQRRVEFWGEGLATFDIKRLSKGIIRSYAGTNHLEGCRWNTTTPPDWMNWCIVQTETNYNSACINNPTPIKPSDDSPEYVW